MHTYVVLAYVYVYKAEIRIQNNISTFLVKTSS